MISQGFNRHPYTNTHSTHLLKNWGMFVYWMPPLFAIMPFKCMVPVAWCVASSKRFYWAAAVVDGHWKAIKETASGARVTKNRCTAFEVERTPRNSSKSQQSSIASRERPEALSCWPSNLFLAFLLIIPVKKLSEDVPVCLGLMSYTTESTVDWAAGPQSSLIAMPEGTTGRLQLKKSQVSHIS